MSRTVTHLDLRCACGKVHGQVRDVSPKAGSPLVCYCGDCQAFASFLGRDDILDAWGGTDILQIAPAAVRLEHEPGSLACVRLSDKGLHRWYCAECKTPLGNSMPKVPFIGLVHTLIDHGAGAAKRESAIGPPLGHIQQKAAKGKPPFPENNVRVISRSVRRVARWFVTGKGKPSPFFDDTGTPRVTPRVLSPDERHAL